MKKKISTFFLLLFFLATTFAQHTYVLLAGISNYGDEKNNLSQTTKDVKSIKEVFDKQKNTTVAILTSKYASGSNIEEKLNAIIKLAKPSDKIIFCFSGHGTTGGFVSYGPQLFPYKTLAQILSKAKAKEVVCFIDACMSGSVQSDAASNYGFSNDATHPGLTFVVASRADEVSWEREGKFAETKYPYVCHGELNAILNYTGTTLKNSKIYVALFPCNECAKAIIQSGIKEIIYKLQLLSFIQF